MKPKLPKKKLVPGELEHKHNFLNTYNSSFHSVYKILAKHWPILLNLKDKLPQKSKIHLPESPNSKKLLGSQNPPKKVSKNHIASLTKGIFNCGHIKCKCCKGIDHRATLFTSFSTGSTYPINSHIEVIHMSFIYCGIQYVGRKTQTHSKGWGSTHISRPHYMVIWSIAFQNTQLWPTPTTSQYTAYQSVNRSLPMSQTGLNSFKKGRCFRSTN